MSHATPDAPPNTPLEHVATPRINEMGASPSELPEKLEVQGDGITDKQQYDTPAPKTMFLSVQPPKHTQPLVALHPALEIELLNTTLDPEDVSVFASLYTQDGTYATRLLEGTMTGVYSDGKFSFSDLKIGVKGIYFFRITAWHGYTRLSSVDSTTISVMG